MAAQQESLQDCLLPITSHLTRCTFALCLSSFPSTLCPSSPHRPLSAPLALIGPQAAFHTLICPHMASSCFPSEYGLLTELYLGTHGYALPALLLALPPLKLPKPTRQVPTMPTRPDPNSQPNPNSEPNPYSEPNPTTPGVSTLCLRLVCPPCA